MMNASRKEFKGQALHNNPLIIVRTSRAVKAEVVIISESSQAVVAADRIESFGVPDS